MFKRIRIYRKNWTLRTRVIEMKDTSNAKHKVKLMGN